MRVETDKGNFTIDFSSDGSIIIGLGVDQKEIEIPGYVLESLGEFLGKHFDIGDNDIGDNKDLDGLIDELECVISRYS